MRKTQPPSTTRAIFSDVRAAEDIKQMFGGFHPPADKTDEQTTASTANLYHSHVYKGAKVTHNSANYD